MYEFKHSEFNRIITSKKFKDLDGASRIKNIVAELKSILIDEVGDTERFFPHFSVHEIEAWILAEGKTLEKKLSCIIKNEENAELIDFENPPKKRIDELFNRYRKSGYKENKDSNALFKEAAFDLVYQKCPYFRQLYDELTEKGKALS